MGQLNSNEVPPNPFVHGWKKTVAASPAPASPPPLRATPAVSPVEQAYRIVSQPLQPARSAAPGSPSFAWPVGLILLGGLVVVIIIAIAATIKSSQSPPPNELHSVTDQVSVMPPQNAVTAQQPHTSRKQARQSVPVTIPSIVAPPSGVREYEVKPSSIPMQRETVGSNAHMPAPISPLSSHGTTNSAIPTAEQAQTRRERVPAASVATRVGVTITTIAANSERSLNGLFARQLSERLGTSGGFSSFSIASNHRPLEKLCEEVANLGGRRLAVPAATSKNGSLKFSVFVLDALSKQLLFYVTETAPAHGQNDDQTRHAVEEAVEGVIRKIAQSEAAR